eukprot:851657_1
MGKRHLLEVEVLVKGYYERVDKPEKNEHNLLTDLTCKVCNVSLQDQNAYDRHIIGKHLATIEGPGFEPNRKRPRSDDFQQFSAPKRGRGHCMRRGKCMGRGRGIGRGSIAPSWLMASVNDSCTVEVSNTDAESILALVEKRLALADAMTLVRRRHRSTVLIDVATLTGACVDALG